MSKNVLLSVLVSLFSLGLAQRAGYAGVIPYGYPVIVAPTTSSVAPVASNNGVGNRFGQDTTTTLASPQLPVDAKGDLGLVNYLNSLPIDQQPFWFINWKASEQHRQEPHTYPTKGNGYIDFASGGGDRYQELLPRFGSVV